MRKLLNTLYVTSEDAYLFLDGENIVCRIDNEVKFRVPFSNIESIYCFNFKGCSPSLMGKCVEYGIPVSFISPYGKFLARVVGETKGNVLVRKKQFEIFDKCKIQMAQNTVAAKLCNTQYVLKRSLRDYPEIDFDSKLSECISSLKDSVNYIYELNDMDEIRGVEGSAAKMYFYIFDRMVLKNKDDFKLNGRTKRPPLDYINAVLSFLYTIYTYDYASAAETAGLDSYVGFYHTLRSGRNSLACDMVEETRCIVERLVLTMINLQILTKKDFDVQPSGATLLNEDGRKKVLVKWQERKRSDIIHPYLKQKIQLGLLPYVQCNLMSKFIRGEINEYPCFLMK